MYNIDPIRQKHAKQTKITIHNTWINQKQTYEFMSESKSQSKIKPLKVTS